MIGFIYDTPLIPLSRVDNWKSFFYVFNRSIGTFNKLNVSQGFYQSLRSWSKFLIGNLRS